MRRKLRSTESHRRQTREKASQSDFESDRPKNMEARRSIGSFALIRSAPLMERNINGVRSAGRILGREEMQTPEKKQV